MTKFVVKTGDCIELLSDMDEQSIDLVFGSPPYEDARTYGIDFKLSGMDWVMWMADVYEECLRVCTGLVAFVVEGRTRKYRWTATPALLMAELHRRGVNLRKPPAFHRVGIPGSGGPDFLRNDYEFIVCATNGGQLPWSDNTAMGHIPKYAPGGEMSHRVQNGKRRNEFGMTDTATSVAGRYADGSHKPRKIMTRMRNQDQPYSPPKKANPGNVIHCIVGGGVMGSKLAHENEAPFPESLAEFLVLSFCRPGGIVLDPFCGSGTTLAAALKHGRKGMGFDVRESQTELTSRRVQEAQQSQTSERSA